MNRKLKIKRFQCKVLIKYVQNSSKGDEVLPVRERTDLILEILDKRKHVPTSYLCEELYCSPATIRRDLIEMEKQGLIERRHGEVSLVPRSKVEFSYLYRETKNLNEKKYISKLASDFISNGQTIFLDASSTVINLCPLLEDYKNLTVLTNGIKTSMELSLLTSIDAFLTGGEIKQGSSAIVGEFSKEFLNNFKADICFISCRSLNRNGIFEVNHHQPLVKRHMMKNSDMTVLLCDSSKFEQDGFFKLADFTQIHTIITNEKPPEDIIQIVNSAGSEIIW